MTVNVRVISGELSRIRLCQAKMQYLITCKVNIDCLLALHDSTVDELILLFLGPFDFYAIV